jgi:glycosyltransferase involved in cell wall biosynthesis
MDVVAIIACRNDDDYLANCLRHLVHNGIYFAVIDNQSTDQTGEILERAEFKRNLVAHEIMPFRGVFSWKSILEAKERLAKRLDAEWFIHLDVDEVMHSGLQGESLHDAIARLAVEGANAINFDEFVFLPVDHDYVRDAAGPQPLHHYYFLAPARVRLMRAWKAGSNLSMVRSGGHELTGASVSLASESLVLRHYIFRNQGHALRKYSRRQFDEYEVRVLGWHYNRIGVPVERFRFPSAAMLERIDRPDDCRLSRSNPRKTHYWEWEPPQAGKS